VYTHLGKIEHLFIHSLSEFNTRCADRVHFMLIRIKTNDAHPAVQICADVHFSVLIRTGVCYLEVHRVTRVVSSEV
jgi:hypothetical protein